MKKIECIDHINPCPKCNELMERRKHRVIGAKQLNKTYYYSEWDYCKPCGHLQHYEQFKVYSNGMKGEENLINEFKRINNLNWIR
jgi:hypothetical protein